MTREFYVVTAPEVRQTDACSFGFMFKSGAPFEEFGHLSRRFGTLLARPYGSNEINPFSLVRGGPAQTAPERLDLQVFESPTGLVLAAGIDHDPAAPEADHADRILEEVPSCVLLTERKLYETVLEPALTRAGAVFKVHHADKALATS